jgi:hypothetical protein
MNSKTKNIVTIFILKLKPYIIEFIIIPSTGDHRITTMADSYPFHQGDLVRHIFKKRSIFCTTEAVFWNKNFYKVNALGRVCPETSPPMTLREFVSKNVLSDTEFALYECVSDNNNERTIETHLKNNIIVMPCGKQDTNGKYYWHRFTKNVPPGCWLKEVHPGKGRVAVFTTNPRHWMSTKKIPPVRVSYWTV